MTPNLHEYLFGALAPDEVQAVERHLESSPEARQELELLRAACAPLQFDKDEIEAPADLVYRTLQKVVAVRCKPLPGTIGPSRPKPMPATTHRSAARLGWRRVDLLVAAGIAFIFLMLIPPALVRARDRQAIVECADNLHRYHVALSQYSMKSGPDGYLPHPDRQGIFSAAAMTNIALRDAGLWDGSMQPVCPAKRTMSLPPVPPTMEEARGFLQADRGAEHRRAIYATLGGCYGYHLGYEDEKGEFQGLRPSLGDNIPLMADRPPRPEEVFDWQAKNSPNHGFRGQNVLYLGGHVRFVTARLVGEDDIYLNRLGRLAAGRGPLDAVLGPGEARPYPEVE
jgi:hypothetical protein